MRFIANKLAYMLICKIMAGVSDDFDDKYDDGIYMNKFLSRFVAELLKFD